MGAQDDLSLVVHQILDGLHGLVDTLGVSDVALGIEGNVEIAADENFLACYVDVFDSFLVEIVHVRYTPSALMLLFQEL